MEVHSAKPIAIDQVRRGEVDTYQHHCLVSSLLVGSAIYDADMVLGRCLPQALPRYLSESLWEPQEILDGPLRPVDRDYFTEACPLD